MIGRTPGRTCATLRWPISAATYSFLYLFPQLFNFLFVHNTHLVQYSKTIKVKYV